MKMNKIIIIITVFVFSVSLAQNSIIQGTITHEKPNKIFLKTEMGFVQIKPEDIIGREDLAKKGDLTYMSDQIEFVRRYVENLSGKTISWKDSLQNKIDNFTYNLLPLNDISLLEKLINKKNLIGFNVTSPHKSNILNHLDSLGEIANKTKTVNTVFISPKKQKIGFNTDYVGFETLIKKK